MSRGNLPFVSVLIPCYNEEKTIKQCLRSVLRQDYPPDRFEVVVIDGGSQDNTRGLVRELMAKHSNLRLIDNPNRTVPWALNIGIKESHGEVIMIVGAHSLAHRNLIARNVRALIETQADCVGGRVQCITTTAKSGAIAAAMRSSFGVGNSTLRDRQESGYVNHVPFPCYRREVFHKYGLFDTEMVKNQDDEFNFRLRKNGGKLFFYDDTVCYYLVRSSFVALWKQYFMYGFFKVRVLQKHPQMISFRHMVPAAFTLSLPLMLLGAAFTRELLWAAIAVMGSYASLALLHAYKLKRKHEGIGVLQVCMAFAVLHTSYGAGFLYGLTKFWPKWRGVRKRAKCIDH